MKNSGLIVATLIFFFIVNTIYFWETRIGALAFPAFLFLVFIYLILILVLVRQLILLFTEKPASKLRIFQVVLLIIVLLLTGYKPSGLIDFEKIDTADLLVARKKGTANCNTTLRLKPDSGFTIRDICFGVTETRGNYHIVNDTIYFTYGQNIKWKDLKYRFAVIAEAEHYTAYPLVLKLYKDNQDTTGYYYFITKNNLGIKIKEPTR